jgi:hypothetical protein
VSKELHGSFSSSKWLLRILRPIVEPTTNLVTVGVVDLFHRCGMQFAISPVVRAAAKRV